MLGCAAMSPVWATSEKIIGWQGFDAQVFERAQADNRLVILNLEAVWCHWCHVMDKTTYADPQVAAFLAEHFITARADQDARPDLSRRYERWGWPATIFYAPDGTELVKRAGYIAPKPMLKLLRVLVDNPTPEAGAVASASFDDTASNSQLDEVTRQRLIQKHLESYDSEKGGLKLAQKFLDESSVELDMQLAQGGDASAGSRARQTLDAALHLLDPAWGGFYQYSTRWDWQHPHYEKIMSTQTRYLRLYARAAIQFSNARYAEAATQTAGYLVSFLGASNGAFFTSQDADLVPGEHAGDFFALADKARRARGMPRIDKHIYARENGWAIEALAVLYEYGGEQQWLDHARLAANWIIANRRNKAGGFLHDEHGANGNLAGPYLGDSLAMSIALLQLYTVTTETAWLVKSQQAADFILGNFAHPVRGFLASAANGALAPIVEVDENIRLARHFNLLYHYTGAQKYKQAAEHSMRFLSHPQVALKRINESGVLLVDMELERTPLHLTVVANDANDPVAIRLFRTALMSTNGYKRAEWWRPLSGELPNHDVAYPRLGKPAGFVCTAKRCSSPRFEAGDYAHMIEKLRSERPVLK